MKSPCMRTMRKGNTPPKTRLSYLFLVTSFALLALLPFPAASLALKQAEVTEEADPLVSAPVDAATPGCEPLQGASGEIFWDYIVVGSGAGGIPFATKVAEDSDCATVLLLEYGGPSLYRTGGRWQATWMEGEELTPFDVWTLTGPVSQNRTHWCDDETTENAACLIGGGTAVNAGQSFTPPSRYWNKYFPEGWQAKDVAKHVDSVRARSPTSPTPSTDGVDYFTELFPPMKSVLEAVGFEDVDPTADFELKERHFGRSQFYTVEGQRGGPVVSYLMDALQLPNFRLQSSTKVLSVLRNGTEVYGVRVEFSGVEEEYMASRVVLAAGAFGTPAILFNSGIGPQAQLTTAAEVAYNDVPQSDWIETPVGLSLHDNPTAQIRFSHPDVLNFTVGTTAFESPDPEFVEMYLEDRSGPYSFLPRVLVLWMDTDVEGVGGEGDKINFQAICSPSGSEAGSILCGTYIGEGVHSRAQVVLDADGKTTYEGTPWMSDAGGLDLQAYAQGVQQMLRAVQQDAVMSITLPEAADLDFEDLSAVEAWLIENGSRTNNHWLGSTRLGDDDGTQEGTDVVGVNCNVYGVEGLFVTDGSLSPAMTTSNPVQMIMAFGEICAAKVLSLPLP